MKIAIGHTLFLDNLQKDEEITSIYVVFPRFFDSKKKLIKREYKSYIYDVWRLRNEIDFAIYPDYLREELPLPRDIKYIYVIHEIEKDSKAFFSLSRKFSLIPGYASDEKYRDYSLEDFLKTFANTEKWYLGVSTRREAKEAITNGFDYMDITTMALSSFSDLRSYESVKKLLLSFHDFVKKEERQTRLSEWISLTTEA